jgi:hypothetical protein
MLEVGEHDDYRWFVGQFDGSLVDVVVDCHLGRRLGISAFDSGLLHPTESEAEEGWTMQGSVALSPPLRAVTHVPHDGFDEWYIFDEQSSPEWSPEVFVNFSTFTLLPVAEIERRRDPTWEAHAFDWLIPLQERFWQQIARIRPLSYVAMGDNDVIVTRNRDFSSKLDAAGWRR